MRLFLPDRWWSAVTREQTGIEDGVVRCQLCDEVFLSAKLVAHFRSTSVEPIPRLQAALDPNREVARRRAHAVRHVESCEATLDTATGHYLILATSEPAVPAAADFGF